MKPRGGARAHENSWGRSHIRHVTHALCLCSRKSSSDGTTAWGWPGSLVRQFECDAVAGAVGAGFSRSSAGQQGARGEFESLELQNPQSRAAMTKPKVPDKGWTNLWNGLHDRTRPGDRSGKRFSGPQAENRVRGATHLRVSQAPRCRRQCCVSKTAREVTRDGREAHGLRPVRERRLIWRAMIARTIRGAHYDRQQCKTSIAHNASEPGAGMAVSTGRALAPRLRKATAHLALLGDGFDRPCGG